MRVGLYVRAAAADPVDRIVERFLRAEAEGFHTAWVGQLLGHDALILLALASVKTRQLELGTWVLPIQPRHPVVLAQQALSVQAASGGRLLLGVGVSHPEVVQKRLGLSWAHPEATARAYLSVLRPLLAGERVERQEGGHALALELERIPTPAPPIFLAALGPRMLALAAERADGVALWLAGPKTLEGFVLPRLRQAAQRAGRPLPRIVCGLPVALCSREEPARAAAETLLRRSARLAAYRRVLEREGAASPAAVALIGDESRLAGELSRLRDLGVTDFHALTFAVEGDPQAPARTRSFLAAWARG